MALTGRMRNGLTYAISGLPKDSPIDKKNTAGAVRARTPRLLASLGEIFSLTRLLVRAHRHTQNWLNPISASARLMLYMIQAICASARLGLKRPSRLVGNGTRVISERKRRLSHKSGRL